MTEMSDNEIRGIFMKIHILTIVIILLFSGCASIKKDMDKGKLGNDKTAPKKEVSPEAERRKIAELEGLNEWFNFRYAQNKVQRTTTFKQPYPFGSIYFEMYYDEAIVKDYLFYDGKIHTDRGWVQNQRTALWEKKADKSEPVQEGVLYINTAYKVAIYYYPRKEDRDFDVFRVRIKSDGERTEGAKPEGGKTESAKPGSAKK